MGSDTGYRVFKRAVWLGLVDRRGRLSAASLWPILAIVLPILWEIVKAYFASRAARIHGSPEDIAEAVRELSTSLPPEAWARRAWAQAEADVADGHD